MQRVSSKTFICPYSNHLDVCVLWDFLSLVLAIPVPRNSIFQLLEIHVGVCKGELHQKWCYLHAAPVQRLAYLLEAGAEAAALSSLGLGIAHSGVLGPELL